MERDDARLLTGTRPVLELLRSGRAVERVLVARERTSSRIVEEIKRHAEKAAIPVRVVPRREIDRLASHANHQGVVAITTRYRYTPMEELLSPHAPALLFLDGVSDPQNLGSLLRTADGAGFDGVVIPARRAAGVTATVRRVSAGAAEVVKVARVANLGQAIDAARRAGLWIVGLDAQASEDLWSTPLLEPPVGIVLGSEGRGISRVVRSRCDGVVRIPHSGKLAALNVAAAGAVAMFEVARRRRRSDTL